MLAEMCKRAPHYSSKSAWRNLERNVQRGRRVNRFNIIPIKVALNWMA